jgi:archaellum component FlaC
MTGNNNVLYSLGSFCPHVPDGSNKTTTYVLGDDNHIWGGLRAAVTSQTNSDSRLKNTIVNIPIEYEQFFNSLRPVSFKYNQNTSDRKHLGFIAQEVENSLNNAGIITKDFAGVCIGADSEKTYSLRYEEFIPLNTWEIQKLKNRVNELEGELKEIKGELNKNDSNTSN